MKHLPKSITTVTLFSKILATLILVLIVPMASFYAGMQYQKAETIGQFELPTAVTFGARMATLSKKAVTDYLKEYTTPATPTTKRLEEYKVFLPEDIAANTNSLSFQVTISVKPASKLGDAFWLSENGVLANNGWITGKRMIASAVKKNGIYQIVSLSPQH